LRSPNADGGKTPRGGGNRKGEMIHGKGRSDEERKLTGFEPATKRIIA